MTILQMSISCFFEPLLVAIFAHFQNALIFFIFAIFELEQLQCVVEHVFMHL